MFHSVISFINLSNNITYQHVIYYFHLNVIFSQKIYSFPFTLRLIYAFVFKIGSKTRGNCKNEHTKTKHEKLAKVLNHSSVRRMQCIPPFLQFHCSGKSTGNKLICILWLIFILCRQGFDSVGCLAKSAAECSIECIEEFAPSADS